MKWYFAEYANSRLAASIPRELSGSNVAKRVWPNASVIHGPFAAEAVAETAANELWKLAAVQQFDPSI